MENNPYIIPFTLSYLDHFFINFSYREVSELVVSIIQARDLTANQYSGSLDTYIRGVLLPDSESRFQTKVILIWMIRKDQTNLSL